MASSLPVQRLAGDALWARVARQARCADSGLDPDQWYSVARSRTGRALTTCTMSEWIQR
jgi:hypothetical protein